MLFKCKYKYYLTLAVAVFVTSIHVMQSTIISIKRPIITSENRVSADVHSRSNAVGERCPKLSAHNIDFGSRDTFTKSFDGPSFHRDYEPGVFPSELVKIENKCLVQFNTLAALSPQLEKSESSAVAHAVTNLTCQLPPQVERVFDRPGGFASDLNLFVFRLYETWQNRTGTTGSDISFPRIRVVVRGTIVVNEPITLISGLTLTGDGAFACIESQGMPPIDTVFDIKNVKHVSITGFRIEMKHTCAPSYKRQQKNEPVLVGFGACRGCNEETRIIEHEHTVSSLEQCGLLCSSTHTCTSYEFTRSVCILFSIPIGEIVFFRV